MKANDSETPKGRRLFAAGKIEPTRGPCNDGHGPHEGPLLDTEAFDAAGPMWSGQGTCAKCGSTIHRDHLKGAA